MSVGWKRQTETDTLCDFALMVKLFAEQAPNSQKLQGLAFTAKLKAEMALQRERVELRDENIALDRITECQRCPHHGTCRNHPNERECNSAKEKVQIIRHHYGDLGLNFIRWAAGKTKEVGTDADDND